MQSNNGTLRAARSLTGLARALAIGANAIGTLTVLVLVIVMNIDVVARGVFHAPFLGVVEIVIFSMILIVFLQLPDVVRVNRLTRSDGFLILIRSSHPRLAEFFYRVIDAIACVLMALIAYATYPALVEAFETCHYFTQPEFGPAPTGDLWTDLVAATRRCHYFGTLGVFTIPWWPANAAITASAGLCAVIFFLKVIVGHDLGEGADASDTQARELRDSAGETS
ncbi:TRAP transporter small permease [Hoeflea prorocentri]|uniref:TRAP transporter small permease protein n=1 Tax=Hoeflea prorocentri TaxID=1922333 RepID=A0A9X3ZIG3_9HYPH|nr:TRAP transporter small permease subunit [Hoeflea prorocentri]MCY6381988.1 TRAP transporter small permease subunit [Hoeflea prorocentri]MDA5399788.1 TRAP transporter small permease subunit [Hoeflea prorocentri]